MKRALALGLSGVSIVTLGLVGSAGSASAACAFNEVYTGYQNPRESVIVSSTSTCNDVNLSTAWDSAGDGFDWYAGFYDSNGWKIGAKGYVFGKDFATTDSSKWIVLLTAVRNGARVGVGSYYDGGDIVTIAH